MSTDTTAATDPETTPTAATMIVIVEGQRFGIPATTALDAIKHTLRAQGFPHIANAQVQEGTETIDGVVTKTIEFVKQAGTKGLSGGALATVIAQAPAHLPEARNRPQRLPWHVQQALHEETLTIEQALACTDLAAALDDSIDQTGGSHTMEARRLWHRFAQLAPTAAVRPPHGW
ncbi:MAG: hypothetical protein HC828_06820 [Blastochloris sp.]|nr:hypothetical protein [Blastochloris sp.]